MLVVFMLSGGCTSIVEKGKFYKYHDDYRGSDEEDNVSTKQYVTAMGQAIHCAHNEWPDPECCWIGFNFLHA